MTYKYGDRITVGENRIKAAEGPATFVSYGSSESYIYFISDLSTYPLPSGGNDIL